MPRPPRVLLLQPNCGLNLNIEVTRLASDPQNERVVLFSVESDFPSSPAAFETRARTRGLSLQMFSFRNCDPSLVGKAQNAPDGANGNGQRSICEFASSSESSIDDGALIDDGVDAGWVAAAAVGRSAG